MDKLNQFRIEFYSIDAMQEPQRTLQLSNLMDKLQQEYGLPLLNNEAYNNKNKAIIQLYKEISSSRNI